MFAESAVEAQADLRIFVKNMVTAFIASYAEKN